MLQNEKRYATIEINKEDIKFSAAHFTIFSATNRERLHGHNFSVSVQLTAAVDKNGLCFGYKEIKDKLRALCLELDEYCLLPGESPYLSYDADKKNHIVVFNNEKMSFLKQDTKILPIKNSSVEEYSYYILKRIINDDDSFFATNEIKELKVKVATSPGQWGSSLWKQET